VGKVLDIVYRAIATLLIDCPPQITLLIIDLYENLIDV
jgi:hypothetical protein